MAQLKTPALAFVTGVLLLAACGGDDSQASAPGNPDSPAPAVPVDAAPMSAGDAGAMQKPDASPAPDAGSPSGYRLPWAAATTMRLTQDCNDACCSDHVGNDAYAWDFGDATSFSVLAARAGTITHLKTSSTTGCNSSTCVNDANYIVVDHGDGTESVYLHLAGGSLAAGVTCGAHVAQGAKLATAGTTGWSSGVHLHFQVNKVHASAPTCECGADAEGCAASTVPWADFWSTSTYPTVPIAFEEWPSASSCANRRMAMPTSLN